MKRIRKRGNLEIYSICFTDFSMLEKKKNVVRFVYQIKAQEETNEESELCM